MPGGFHNLLNMVCFINVLHVLLLKCNCFLLESKYVSKLPHLFWSHFSENNNVKWNCPLEVSITCNRSWDIWTSCQDLHTVYAYCILPSGSSSLPHLHPFLHLHFPRPYLFPASFLTHFRRAKVPGEIVDGSSFALLTAGGECETDTCRGPLCTSVTLHSET